MPVEATTADLSDTENDISVYEAHLNCNLQNVALILNQKEGMWCAVLIVVTYWLCF